MKTWQSVLLGFIGGLLLSGVILLLILPQRGEPIQLVTTTPDQRAQGTPTAAAIEVYVAGEVKSTGVYSLPAGSRVHAAISAAGGAAQDADLDRNLVLMRDRLKELLGLTESADSEVDPDDSAIEEVLEDPEELLDQA